MPDFPVKITYVSYCCPVSCIATAKSSDRMVRACERWRGIHPAQVFVDGQGGPYFDVPRDSRVP